MKKTLVYDSSRLSTYLECPMMDHYGNVEGITQSNEPSEVIVIGTLGHKYLELYYSKKDIDMKAAIQDMGKFGLAPDFPVSSELIARLKERLTLYWMKYSSQHDIEVSMKKTKRLAIVDGIIQIVNDCDPYVEKGFSYKLLDTKEYLFILEGRIDLFGIFSGTHMWMDHKFQLRERDLYEGSIQFKNYALATGCDIGMVNYVRLHQKVSESTLKRVPISFTPLQMRIWKDELIETYIRIAKEEPWRNWASCSGKFGYKCQYTEICNNWKNPQFVQVVKDRFVKKQEWKPW